MRPHSTIARRSSDSFVVTEKFNMARGLYITRVRIQPCDALAFYQYKNRMKYIRPSARFRQAQPASSGHASFSDFGLPLRSQPVPPPDISIIPGLDVTPSLSPPRGDTPARHHYAFPLPTARVGVGDHAFFNGDYDTALLHYSIALQDSPDPMIRAAAKWGEARSILRRNATTKRSRHCKPSSRILQSRILDRLLFTGICVLPPGKLSIRR